MKNKLTYSDKLKDPRWQKKRLEILNRDNFKCTFCGDKSSTLHVHHLAYARTPWDVPNEDLVTTCSHCHHIIEFFKKNDYTVTSIMKFMESNDESYIILLAKTYEEQESFYITELRNGLITAQHCLSCKDVESFLKS